MKTGPDEFEAAAAGVPPLFPEHTPVGRHAVKATTRTLPAKPVDPNVLPGFTPPEPKPRKVPVKKHTRRNPRHHKEPQMDLDQHAHARPDDPGTSHVAAAEVRDLSKSQTEVLGLFREHAAWFRDNPWACGQPETFPPGYTDEVLVDKADRAGSWTSPSRLRSARKELVVAGLLKPTGERRKTQRGRMADVYDLTVAGIAVDLS